MAKAKQAENTIYQLKITLLDSEPPIWRRVLIPGTFNFEQVHAVIQASMGWSNSHLHQFVLGEAGSPILLTYPSFEIDGMPVKDLKAVEQVMADLGSDTTHLSLAQLKKSNTLDETAFRLRDVVTREGAALRYKYDFGDSWDHKIQVEKIFAPEPGVDYPACIAGARSCPPEDCGGIHAYADLLEALSDPKREDHEDALSWVGEDFDPEYFDLEENHDETSSYEDYLVPPDGALELDEEEILSDEDVDEALGMLTEQAKAFIQEVIPSPDGFALRFPGGIPLVNVVIPQFVTIIFAQYPLLKIIYETGPVSEPVWVRVTGSEEELKALKETLGIK